MILEFLTKSTTLLTRIILLLSTRLVVHLSRTVNEVSQVHLVDKREGERLSVTLYGYAFSVLCPLLLSCCLSPAQALKQSRFSCFYKPICESQLKPCTHGLLLNMCVCVSQNDANHCQWLVKGQKMPIIKERVTCLCCFPYISHYVLREKLRCRQVSTITIDN